MIGSHECEMKECYFSVFWEYIIIFPTKDPNSIKTYLTLQKSLNLSHKNIHILTYIETQASFMALITSPPSNPKAHQFSPLPCATRRPGQAKLVPEITSAALVHAAESKPEPEAAKFRRILLSDVVVKSQKRVFFGRKWNAYDLATASVILAMHCLCLFAPFQFNWRALLVAVALYIVTGLFGITLSFHRNLSHRSFKVPKWLEYFFAYCGVQALQVCRISLFWLLMVL